MQGSFQIVMQGGTQGLQGGMQAGLQDGMQSTMQGGLQQEPQEQGAPKRKLEQYKAQLQMLQEPDGRSLTLVPIGAPDDASPIEVDASPMTDMTDEPSPEDYIAADAMLAEAPDPNPNPNPNPEPEPQTRTRTEPEPEPEPGAGVLH